MVFISQNNLAGCQEGEKTMPWFLLFISICFSFYSIHFKLQRRELDSIMVSVSMNLLIAGASIIVSVIYFKEAMKHYPNITILTVFFLLLTALNALLGTFPNFLGKEKTKDQKEDKKNDTSV